jgi:DNA-binding SARP family transcriptional activator
LRTRIYLTGKLWVEAGDSFIDERMFPSRQGRIAFAYLAIEHDRPIPREELADVIWLEELPPGWEGALSAIVSKLRTLLKQLGPTGPEITIAAGSHQLRAPSAPWIDVEVAGSSIDEAEGLLRRGKASRAWGPANVAAAIASRPFLPREELGWVEKRRRVLQEIHLRSLECLSEIALQNGELPLAARIAAEAVEREPFREAGYRRLMRAHEAMGNRAEALRVYHLCLRLLAEELGVRPSSETEALYLALIEGPK